jgi:hypothetical protein
MSHFDERAEKNCLNCKTEVVGRFCHVCGQENIQPKESFWHLLKHLVFHEFHYDGKFISTVKYLILKPGYLTQEYFKGKRVSYLDPIRMYIFISAFFFLVTFSLYKNEKMHLNKENVPIETKAETLKEKLTDIKEAITDSIYDNEHLSKEDKERLTQKKNSLKSLLKAIPGDSPGKLKDSIGKIFSFTVDTTGKKHKAGLNVGWGAIEYSSLREYDSLQIHLPENKRDNFISAAIIRRVLEKKAGFESHPDEMLEHVGEELIHSVSEILFVSLPFFALILQLLYTSKRKEYFYVNHFIYTLHLYCGAFISLLFFFCLTKLKEVTHLTFFNYASAGILIYWVYYSYKSMRIYYGQSRRKTLVKYWLLNVLSTILMLFLFVLFALIAALNA